MEGEELRGLYIGRHRRLEPGRISRHNSTSPTSIAHSSGCSRPRRRCYDDLWTAAKAMYKTEPVIADGGEVIIYAPHITEVSYTHGKLIDEVGYHVKDYFLKQWDRFKDVPGSILAHSTHVKARHL